MSKKNDGRRFIGLWVDILKTTNIIMAPMKTHPCMATTTSSDSPWNLASLKDEVLMQSLHSFRLQGHGKA